MSSQDSINNVNRDMQFFSTTSKGSTSAISHLLYSGNSENFKDKNGNSLLHLAVQSDITDDVVKLLLNKGTLIDDKAENGRTALHTAVEWGRRENIILLLNNGANINAKDKEGKTPLHLVVGKNVYFYGKKIVERFEKITKLLLWKSAQIDECDIAGQTPLFTAVIAKKSRSIAILLDHGAKINAKDNSHMSPLHFAVVSNDIQIVKLLLDRGADISAKDEIGSSPLHFAVEYNNVHIAKFLLEKGAIIDDVRKDGYTALHTAVHHGQEDSVMLLLDNNANVNVKEDGGKTPLHLIVQKCLQGCNKETVQKFKRIAKLLIFRGIPVNSITDTGQSVLHVAAISRNQVMVKLLLENGANINHKNNYGEYPLYCAVKSKNDRIVKFLLKKGASVNVKRNDGSTVLHEAVRIEDMNMIHILLENKADINIQDEKGKTPLSLAIVTMDDSWLSKVITMYLAKLNKKVICRENLRLLQSNEKLNRFYSNCLLELNMMKNYKICYKISLYNILSGCESQLGKYARSQNVMKFFKSNEYRIQFPIYCTILQRNFRKGLERKHQLERVEISINFLWEHFNLTDLLVQKILYHVNSDDLQFMAKASECSMRKSK